MNDDLTKRLDEDALFNRLCNSEKVSMTSIVVDAFNIGAKSRQAEIDELQLSATEMSDYIDKAQSCLPYFLKDEKTDSNWIGGIQNKIVDYEAEIDRLQRKLKGISESADWHIEDCACSHPMSKYQLGWFEAMTLVKNKLEGCVK